MITEETIRTISNDACALGFKYGADLVLRLVKEFIAPAVYEKLVEAVNEGEMSKEGERVMIMLDKYSEGKKGLQ